MINSDQSTLVDGLMADVMSGDRGVDEALCALEFAKNYATDIGDVQAQELFTETHVSLIGQSEEQDPDEDDGEMPDPDEDE